MRAWTTATTRAGLLSAFMRHHGIGVGQHAPVAGRIGPPLNNSAVLPFPLRVTPRSHADRRRTGSCAAGSPDRHRRTASRHYPGQPDSRFPGMFEATTGNPQAIACSKDTELPSLRELLDVQVSLPKVRRQPRFVHHPDPADRPGFGGGPKAVFHRRPVLPSPSTTSRSSGTDRHAR